MIEINDFVSSVKKFHASGWMPGSSGAVAELSDTISTNSKKIFMTPDTFDVCSLSSSDLFVLRDLYGSQDVQTPIRGNFTLSKWASVFFYLLGKTSSNAVVFLPTKNASLISLKTIQMWRENSESHPNLLRLGYWGLLTDLGYTSEMYIPVIDCKADEALTHVENVFNHYPFPFPAILVRGYGLLTWDASLATLRNK
ncbi:hypothetical protein C4588_02985, partial [Candidatus Parcubacteria bacterium]